MIKRRPALLVAEDDSTARKQLTRFLEKSGFFALTANNGREALELFKKQEPEIVLTDLKMPELNGIKLLEEIRKINSRTKVIIMTAYGDMQTVIRAMRLGAFDFIEKPLNLSELSQSLERAYSEVENDERNHLKPGLLIVEDDEQVRERLAKIIKLEKSDWRVYTAETVESGRRLFSCEKIDILIADVRLPDGNGLELIDELEEKNGDFESLVLTGYGDEKVALKALKSGVFDFFPKPPEVEKILDSIDNAMLRLTDRRAAEYKKITRRKN
jgi:DNA-binding NtrC family response regulator